MSEEKQGKRTWTEEIEVSGKELVDKVKEWIEDSKTSRIIIRKPSGEVWMEVPVVTGAAVGGAAVLFMPVVAAIGALAALVASVKVEVVHEEDDDAANQPGDNDCGS